MALCVELTSDRPRHVVATIADEHPGALAEHMEDAVRDRLRVDALLPASGGDAPPEVTLAAARKLAARLRPYGTVGISGFYADAAELGRALQEAELALDVMRRSDVAIAEQIDSGSYRLLFRMMASHPEEVHAFYEDTVAPIAENDEQYATDLVPTLEAYPPNRRAVPGAVRLAAGLGEPELLAALDEAVRSGMIEELPSPGLACRFTHELVRRALYDRLSGPRRAELHLRVGEALEAAGTRSGRALADLAYHFAAAAPFGGAERAVEYNLLAARAASRGLAFEEAAARLRTALALGIDRREHRAEVFLELGNATNRGGKAADALDAFRAAADSGRELGDARLLARAAIGYEDASWRPGMSDRAAVELLEEAAAALDDDDSELRVGLLSGLARALDRQGHRERGVVVRGSAIAMARRLDDRAGLATLLARSYWSRGTTPPEEILAMVTEARDLAAALGDTEIVAEAMAWRVTMLVALCDHDSARREVAALRATAERTAQPFMHHVAEQYGSVIALCDGRLEAAEALARRRASSPCSPTWAWRRRRAGSSRASSPAGSTRSANRSGSPRSRT